MLNVTRIPRSIPLDPHLFRDHWNFLVFNLVASQPNKLRSSISHIRVVILFSCDSHEFSLPNMQAPSDVQL